MSFSFCSETAPIAAFAGAGESSGSLVQVAGRGCSDFVVRRADSGFNPAACVLEVHRVLLDANESLPGQHGRHTGGAASQERVNDRIRADGATEPLDLGQGAGAWNGVLTPVAVPLREVR